MTDLTIQLRTHFEEWCNCERYSCDKDSDGNYLFPASSRWAAWFGAYNLYHDVGLESLVPQTEIQFADRQACSEYSIIAATPNKNNSK